MRGFGRKGSQTQLKDYMKKSKIDILRLQETIRQDFSLSELQNLIGNDTLFWSWTPASGHSGGILLGIRESSLEVGRIDKGESFISASLYYKELKFKFEFVGVYGPADHARSPGFLHELDTKLSA